MKRNHLHREVDVTATVSIAITLALLAFLMPAALFGVIGLFLLYMLVCVILGVIGFICDLLSPPKKVKPYVPYHVPDTLPSEWEQ